MQPYKAPPAFLKDLAPLLGDAKNPVYDSICLKGGDHDILAVQGTPVCTGDDSGLAHVTWRGCTRETRRGFALRSGRLVHEGAPQAGWKGALVPFTGTVIAGVRPHEDDIFPGYLLHALGYPRECLELVFDQGQLRTKERCDPWRVWEMRPTEDVYADDESWAALLSMALRHDWPDKFDCSLPTQGADSIGGRDLDRLLSMMVRIVDYDNRNLHPSRSLALLVRGLRDGSACWSASGTWTRWHQQLHEAFHWCGCLGALEQHVQSHAWQVQPEDSK